MKRTLIISLTTLIMAGSAGFGSAFAQTQPPAPSTPSAAPGQTPGHNTHEHHPAIHRAIVALEEAKHALQQANHDFGGHRQAALEECDKAIAQLRLALQYDKK